MNIRQQMKLYIVDDDHFTREPYATTIRDFEEDCRGLGWTPDLDALKEISNFFNPANWSNESDRQYCKEQITAKARKRYGKIRARAILKA